MRKISESFDKIKNVVKPLSIALILIAIVFSLTPEKNKTSSLANLYSPNTLDSQSVFANPALKSQPELPHFIMEQNNSFRSTCPPFTITPQVLGALAEGYTSEDLKKTIVEYEVESGDSLSLIAEKFGISIKTILWANNMESSVLQVGKKLIIPPVSGVVHYVKNGDTVSQIALKYKAETEEIIAFNQLSDQNDIAIGDILIVPGGVIAATTVKPAASWVPIANSYFICPVALPCRITQGLHWYNAIDFSHGKCGEPIYAAAGGTVLKVKLTDSTSKYVYQGAGNHITILHPNGVVTMYGHIATSFVQVGEDVYQGQVIASMGGQPGTPGAGNSTGCHLHFGITGATNPFAK